MTKTFCDIDGASPACNYRLVNGTNMRVAFSIDLCDACVDALHEYLRSRSVVADLQPVSKDNALVLPAKQ